MIFSNTIMLNIVCTSKPAMAYYVIVMNTVVI